ncbi:MAG TPA: hypothetical protein VK742_02350 [Candidatus Sulfotelmatobacter sp.]|nr:hypothetical protein [Candidatus Sulfotelmatobacter sp.]
MAVAGYILAVIGFIACLAGEIKMMAISYRYGFGWLLGCMLMGPLCWLLLLMIDFRSMSKPFGLTILGVLAVGIGDVLIGIKG